MPTQKLEIWKDSATLAYLRTHRIANAVSRDEKKRIEKRAKCHRFIGEHLEHYRSGIWRQVPKPAYRKTLIQRTHTEKLAHAKKTAVLKDLQSEYCWDGMESDVPRVLRECQTCAQTTPKFLAPPPSTEPPPLGPLDCWSIDLVTFEKGYLITCVDYFSRWAEVGVLANKEALTVWTWFEAPILHRYGPPKKVISDNGGEFSSHFAENLRRRKIEHSKIDAGCPSQNGRCERFNGTIQKRIRSLQNQANKDQPNRLNSWKQFVSSAICAYRFTIHSAHQRTPFEILYGKRPSFVLPEEEDQEMPIEEEDQEMPIEEEPFDPVQQKKRVDKLEQIRCEVVAWDKCRREKARKCYMKKRTSRSNEVPSQIYLRNRAKHRKEDASVRGPYTVLDSDRIRLQIQLPSGPKWVPREHCALCEQTF